MKFDTYTSIRINSDEEFRKVKQVLIDLGEKLYACTAERDTDSFGTLLFNGKSWSGHYRDLTAECTYTAQEFIEKYGNPSSISERVAKIRELQELETPYLLRRAGLTLSLNGDMVYLVEGGCADADALTLEEARQVADELKELLR